MAGTQLALRMIMLLPPPTPHKPPAPVSSHCYSLATTQPPGRPPRHRRTGVWEGNVHEWG